MNKNPIVTFEMKDGDVFHVELYPEIAPNTVNNFISLTKKGEFYTPLSFFMHFFKNPPTGDKK